MPTFYTGDPSLNVALTGLARAMFPPRESPLDQAYRAAQVTRAQAAAENERMQTQMLREQQATSQALAPVLGEQLVQTNLGDRPGISTDPNLAGPPTASTAREAELMTPLARAMLAREGTISQFADAINTAQGGLGVAFGPRERLGRNALLLAGGSRDLGDIEAAAAATPGEGIPGLNLNLEGTGVEAQAINFVNGYNQRRQQGIPSQPGEDRMYAILYDRLYGPKTQQVQRYDPETNAFYLQNVQVPQQAPAGLLQPGQLPAPQAAPSSVGPTAAPVPGDPPLNQALLEGEVQLPAGATDEQVMAAAQEMEGGTGVPVPLAPATVPAAPTEPPGLMTRPGPTPPKPPKPTELQGKYRIFGARIEQAMGRLFNLMGYDIQSGELAQRGYRPNIFADIAKDWQGDITRTLRNLVASDNDKRFFTAVAQVLNPLIRADSGAAVPTGEYPRYYDQFIPSFNDPDEVVQAKLDNILVTQMAFDELSNAGLAVPADNAPPEVKQEYALRMQQAKNRIARETNRTMFPVSYGGVTTTDDNQRVLPSGRRYRVVGG